MNFLLRLFMLIEIEILLLISVGIKMPESQHLCDLFLSSSMVALGGVLLDAVQPPSNTGQARPELLCWEACRGSSSKAGTWQTKARQTTSIQ